MTLSQAKAIFIQECTAVSILGINYISNYLNSCSDDNFNENIFKALMKNEGVRIDDIFNDANK